MISTTIGTSFMHEVPHYLVAGPASTAGNTTIRVPINRDLWRQR